MSHMKRASASIKELREFNDICNICMADGRRDFLQINQSEWIRSWGNKMAIINELQICHDCWFLITERMFDYYTAESLAMSLKEKRPESNLYKKKKIEAKLRWQVFKRDGFKCLNCGADEGLHADHIIPESLGGETILENLQTLCKKCNSIKRVKHVDYRIIAKESSQSNP